MKPFIVLSGQCNLHCKYCFYTQTDGFSAKKLDLQYLKKFISEARSKLDDEVIVTGGEPFLYKGIYDLLDFLSDTGIKTRINSNLTLLNQEAIRKIKPAVSRIDTSIDHIDPEVNNKSRGGYKQTMNSLRMLKEENIPIGISVVLSKANYKDVKIIFNELDKLGAEYLFFQTVDIRTPSLKDKFCLSTLGKMELEKLFSNLEPWAEKYHHQGELNMMRKYFINGAIPRKKCGMTQDLFVIDYTGDVFPCFHRHDLKCGNITKDKTADILDNLESSETKIEIKYCFGPKCVPLF